MLRVLTSRRGLHYHPAAARNEPSRVELADHRCYQSTDQQRGSMGLPLHMHISGRNQAKLLINIRRLVRPPAAGTFRNCFQSIVRLLSYCEWRMRGTSAAVAGQVSDCAVCRWQGKSGAKGEISVIEGLLRKCSFNPGLPSAQCSAQICPDGTYPGLNLRFRTGLDCCPGLALSSVQLRLGLIQKSTPIKHRVTRALDTPSCPGELDVTV